MLFIGLLVFGKCLINVTKIPKIEKIFQEYKEIKWVKSSKRNAKQKEKAATTK